MANTVNVTIVMQDGDEIRLELYPDAAPATVQNFLALVQKGYYNGLCFHRVIDGFMIQGGGFVQQNGALVPAPGAQTVRGEFASNGFANPLRHTAGVISMARTPDKNSASSQFFICVADTPFLDGEYAAFGKVRDAESLQKAVSIGKVRTHSVGYYDDVPVAPVAMQTILLR